MRVIERRYKMIFVISTAFLIRNSDSLIQPGVDQDDFMIRDQ